MEERFNFSIRNTLIGTNKGTSKVFWDIFYKGNLWNNFWRSRCRLAKLLLWRKKWSDGLTGIQKRNSFCEDFTSLCPYGINDGERIPVWKSRKNKWLILTPKNDLSSVSSDTNIKATFLYMQWWKMESWCSLRCQNPFATKQQRRKIFSDSKNRNNS